MGLDRRLHDRWKAPEGGRQASEVVSRLVAGRPLDGLGLGAHEGRVDLRGLPAPAPRPGARSRVGGIDVRELEGLVTVRGARWEGLDLRGARLESLRFFESSLVDCRFDAAACRDWRLWAVDLERCSFRGANLRSSMLGGWHQGRGNVFRDVDFSEAELRGLVCPTATFVDCDFSHARLVKVDFQSSAFVRCRFAGELRKVIFWDRGFQTGKPDPNPMEDVDFTDAELPFVEFRRLDLDRVRLPAGPRHLIVHRYRCALRCAEAALAGDRSPAGIRLRAAIAHRLRWAGQRQEVGVFHDESLGESDEEVTASAELLRRCERECAPTAGSNLPTD